MKNALTVSNYDALAVVDDPAERLHKGWLEALLRDIHAATNKGEAMRAAVAANPGKLAFGTLKTQYYAWKKYGTAGLVDRRKLRRFSKVSAWVECYMTYCERHNRSNLGAWRVMIDDMWAGKVLPHGVGDWRDAWRAENPQKAVPAECPENWYPKCARYETLQRSVKTNPDYLFQIAASRKGRKNAHEFLLPVLKTRIGLEPGQVLECDDLHIDAECVMPGLGKIARPQKFVIYDIASGFQTASTMRPQYPETTGNRRNSLKEREFRMLHAYQLTDVGFHKAGVRIVVEHGTTAIREPVERRVKSIPVYGSLISYDRSGILAEAVHGGFFKGDGGGNFRIKAYCEQAHRLEHSRRAMLPGQVGQDADHRPESHAALVKYDQLIMDAVMKLPEESRDLVRYNLCDWQTFARLEMMLVDAIYDDPNHRLEGWAEKRVTVWRMSETDRWHPVSELDDMNDTQRAAIMAFLQSHPQHVWNRAMTRREAWYKGVRNLIKIPLIELPLMLDDRPWKAGGDARTVTVKKNGTFGFVDQFYYGPDEVIYHATCKTRAGYQAALVPGRDYLFFGTPVHPDGGVIVEPESGKVIGVAPAYKRAPVYDREAILRAAGDQNADLAAKMLPIRGRHQQEAEQRLALIGNNASVLSRKGAVAAEAETEEADDDVPDAMDVAAEAYARDGVHV